MNIIGLIGGTGPESTIDYYRRLIAGHQQRTGDGSYPRIVINSIDLTPMIALVSAMKWEQLADELVREVARLEAAGASVGALTANTPHVVFDEIERRSDLPLVSIVRAACYDVARRGLRRVAVLGTRFTMTAPFYRDVFSRAGIEVVVPSAAEQDYLHDKYMNELLAGTFAEGTRARVREMIETLGREQKIDGAILAGTELPLLITDESVAGIPLLDTTAIHVEAILSAAENLDRP
jgi:aspartate racemase